jgi:hypothetical protein
MLFYSWDINEAKDAGHPGFEGVEPSFNTVVLKPLLKLKETYPFLNSICVSIEEQNMVLVWPDGWGHAQLFPCTVEGLSLLALFGYIEDEKPEVLKVHSLKEDFSLEDVLYFEKKGYKFWKGNNPKCLKFSVGWDK